MDLRYESELLLFCTFLDFHVSHFVSFESIELVITISIITIRLSVIYSMRPVTPKKGLKQETFYNEYNDYLEKLSGMNENMVIVDDLNIEWVKKN